MQRFHVHVAVADVTESIKFYSAFFNSASTVENPQGIEVKA